MEREAERSGAGFEELAVMIEALLVVSEVMNGVADGVRVADFGGLGPGEFTGELGAGGEFVVAAAMEVAGVKEVAADEREEGF